MTKLKTLDQNKQKEPERGCESVHSEEEARSSSEYNVQTLIRPQVTNPKTFWSKSEDEDFSSQNVKNAVLEEKVITNVFKPIRSGISSEVARVKPAKSRSEDLRDEKSIHKSLRVQKVRKRTRLPISWDDKESCQKAQTYDPNYYSSLMKGINPDNTDYYSSSRKNISESSYPVRSASDELIYGEKKTTPRTSMETKQTGRKLERISVTEPSSPLNGNYLLEVSVKRESSDSELDSGSARRETVSEMKKSKSFVEKKEAEGYFTSKPRSKTSTLEICRYSQSSSSSCDSARRTRSLQKTTKSKRKQESRDTSKSEYYTSKSHFCQSEKHWVEEQDRKLLMRKSSDFGVVRKEKSQPWNRDVKTELQQMRPDVFQHLIEVLLQKNRTEFPNEKQKEFLTKSLPRNISRRLKEERSGKDALKVIKSVLEKDYGKHH